MLNTDSVDIYCITESWLKPSTPDSVLTADNIFSIYRKDRVPATGGGTCIIVNNSKVKAIRVNIADRFEDLDIVCIDIVNCSMPIRLVAGYRPPHSSDSAVDAVQYTNHFIDCLISVCDVDSSVVLVGDFNMPSIDWCNLQFVADSAHCSTLFATFVKQYCFEQFVLQATHLQPESRSSSLLDLVLCNDPFIISDVSVCAPFSTSDHCTVIFNIVCPTHSVNLPAHQVRDFSKADWNSISCFLNRCDWSDVFIQCSSANECSAAFYSKLDEAISEFVPLNVFKSVKSNKQYAYPAHIRRLFRAKAAAWRRYKRFKSKNFQKQYKQISSRCRKAIYAYTVKREENIINSGNLGKFFRYANSKFTRKSSIGPLQDADGNKTIDPHVKAELLSKFFQTQFTTDNKTQPSMHPRTTDAGISEITFTPLLVSRIIKKLNAQSAGGPDGIPPVFFKHTSNAICQPLAFLFRVLFDEGCLPPVWRQAFITTIYKKGDSSLSSNYRPISLTCTMCKLMESIIKDQLLNFLLLKGLISKQQHAFIKKHSTVTNLLECTHDWEVALHGGHSVDIIYIDCKRAFDSVVYSKLIFKLNQFGISGKLLYWISAFLTERSQCVVVEHCYSSWTPVLSGVPQGSVLGPILFILFIDDIGMVCSGTVTHKLFADDLKLFSVINTSQDHISLQSTLDRLHEWCGIWQLTINSSKCYSLHLGKNNVQNTYFINGCQIAASQVVTDLGVEIDADLNFDAHINKIVGKAYARLGVLFKGFASRDIQMLKRAYVTYVRPLLEYASSVWSPYLLKHINAIERVQKNFTKRIRSLSELPYPERLAVVDLEPLELRRLKADLVLYYKCFANLVALPCEEYFVTSDIASQTRTGGDRIVQSVCNTNRFQNDFFNRCANCWNFLPADVVAANSVQRFKSLLTTVDLRRFLRCSYF